MLRKHLFYTFLLYLSLCSSASFAQTALKTVAEKFSAKVEHQLQEKVYVHTDKQLYLAGDIVWFKIYNVAANNFQLLNLSKVAYIEILDQANKPLLQGRVHLENGSGNGSFHLPVSLSSGVYKLRAYTNWMKNSGPEVFFEKTLSIINSFTISHTPKKAAAYYVDLFPEGGNLVYGIESRVAFKISDSSGAGITARLLLLRNNDTIHSVEPLKFGMGSFYFTPQKGNTYAALVQLPNGQTIKKDFPKIFDEGYVMRTEQENAIIRISVQSNLQGADVLLFVHNGSRQIYSTAGRFQDGKIEFSVPLQQLSEGVNCFTVFDYNMRPVCERLVFIRPQDKNQITITTDSKTYATRQKVSVNIPAASVLNQDHLSFSVYRIDSLQMPDETNIKNYLWLTSNLSGRVESPDYYLETKEADYDKAADHLMLTHGWRRFKWENILPERRSPIQYPLEYHGPIVSGRVVNPQTSQPVKGVNAFLSVPGKWFLFTASRSDSAGKVLFDVPNYFGEGDVVVQTNVNEDSLTKVVLESPYDHRYTTDKLPEVELSNEAVNDLKQYHIAVQSQNIYSKEKWQQFALPSDVDTLPFFGTLGKSYVLDNYTRFTTMEEVLREYIREINVDLKNGKPYLYILDEVRRDLFRENMLVLLDGIPLFRPNEIFAYDPLNVEKIQVIPQRYLLGPSAFNGIASFTTYKGNYEGLPLHTNALAISYNGLQLEREFYVPEYANPYQIKTRIPDFRTTLYWSGHPFLKENNNNISFYTSDISGTYLANIQGIDKDGRPFSASVSFEVKAKE